VKTLLENGDLEMGMPGPCWHTGEDQIQASRLVVARGLSVRETERLVRRMLQQSAGPKATALASDPDTRRLQDDLSERLGAVVHIRHTARGKGKLVIQYNNLEELDGILAHIR